MADLLLSDMMSMQKALWEKIKKNGLKWNRHTQEQLYYG